MKRITAHNLKEENYIEILALVCERVMKKKTYEGRLAENERIYERLIELADENDSYDLVERLWSAVFCGIEEEG